MDRELITADRHSNHLVYVPGIKAMKSVVHKYRRGIHMQLISLSWLIVLHRRRAESVSDPSICWLRWRWRDGRPDVSCAAAVKHHVLNVFESHWLLCHIHEATDGHISYGWSADAINGQTGMVGQNMFNMSVWHRWMHEQWHLTNYILSWSVWYSSVAWVLAKVQWFKWMSWIQGRS